jgi:hypothetical protein
MTIPSSNGSPAGPLPAGAEGPQIQHGMAPVDTGNPLLSIVPQNLTVSPQQTPAGQRLCVTVRTVDTTLTVFLAADEVEQWIDVLRQGKGQLNGLILPG